MYINNYILIYLNYPLASEKQNLPKPSSTSTTILAEGFVAFWAFVCYTLQSNIFIRLFVLVMTGARQPRVSLSKLVILRI